LMAATAAADNMEETWHQNGDKNSVHRMVEKIGMPEAAEDSWHFRNGSRAGACVVGEKFADRDIEGAVAALEGVPAGNIEGAGYWPGDGKAALSSQKVWAEKINIQGSNAPKFFN
jgi:hypothetical protein